MCALLSACGTVSCAALPFVSHSPIPLFGVVESAAECAARACPHGRIAVIATEAAIRESFSENLKGTTVIILAQRISSVKDADEIIVMNDGVITGVGSHEELLASNAEYGEIYYSQMEKKEAQ